MRFVHWVSAWGVRLVAVGLVLALVVVYVALPYLQFEDWMFLVSVAKTTFLAGIICLWIAILVSDVISALRPKNAG